jgi:3-dehydroquinate synthase
LSKKVRVSKKQNKFQILKYLERDSRPTQRQLSNDLGVSLGKINYCLKSLIEKGFIKVDHVHNDVREGGKRLLLNYGHTLGHAIEMATQTEEGEIFRHGEGVSLGMVAVAHIAQLHLSTPIEVGQKIKAILKAYNLPTSFSASKLGLKRDELIDSCARLTLKDKKRKDNQLRFVLVNEPGSADVHTGIHNEHIIQAYQAVIKD